MGSASIYVTHDQNEALRLADRIMIMNDNGEVAQIGTPYEITQKPNSDFVKEFICNEPLSRDKIKND
jgi:ABC-type proline/glycine betaine transport system ATPase subunit